MFCIWICLCGCKKSLSDLWRKVSAFHILFQYGKPDILPFNVFIDKLNQAVRHYFLFCHVRVSSGIFIREKMCIDFFVIHLRYSLLYISRLG
jgi:hypothetical protein